METKIEIDYTPITQKYDYQTITDICAWALVTLDEKQQEKWYNRLNPFAHFFPGDFDVLTNELKQAMEKK